MYGKKCKSRKLYTHEQDLIKILQKGKRSVDGQINKMRQLSYTQEEINDMGDKFYKEVCRKSFQSHRLSLKLDLQEYNKLIKSDKYTNFWKELHNLDLKIYGRACLLFK